MSSIALVTVLSLCLTGQSGPSPGQYTAADFALVDVNRLAFVISEASTVSWWSDNSRCQSYDDLLKLGRLLAKPPEALPPIITRCTRLDPNTSAVVFHGDLPSLREDQELTKYFLRSTTSTGKEQDRQSRRECISDGFRCALGHTFLAASQARNNERSLAIRSLGIANAIQSATSETLDRFDQYCDRKVLSNVMIGPEFEACRRPQLLVDIPRLALEAGELSEQELVETATHQRYSLGAVGTQLWVDEGHCRLLQITCGRLSSGSGDFAPGAMALQSLELFEVCGGMHKRLNGLIAETAKRGSLTASQVNGLSGNAWNFNAKAAGGEPYFDFIAMDINGDGRLTVSEAKALQQRIEIDFPAEFFPTVISVLEQMRANLPCKLSQYGHIRSRGLIFSFFHFSEPSDAKGTRTITPERFHSIGGADGTVEMFRSQFDYQP